LALTPLTLSRPTDHITLFTLTTSTISAVFVQDNSSFKVVLHHQDAAVDCDAVLLGLHEVAAVHCEAVPLVLFFIIKIQQICSFSCETVPLDLSNILKH
jgi:hypothetical protein